MRILAVDVETTGLNPYDEKQKLLCVGTFNGEQTSCTPIQHSLGTDALRERCRSLLCASDAWIGHNLKFDMHWLWTKLRVEPPNILYDTLALYHLLDENGNKSLKVLRPETKAVQEIEKIDVRKLTDTCDFERLARYNESDARSTYALFGEIKDRLEKEGLLQLAHWQRKLTRVLFDIERTGFCIDAAQKATIQQGVEQNLEQLDRVLHERDSKLNLDSPKQLAKLLYDIWRLPCLDETEKGAPSTSEATLKRLIQDPRCGAEKKAWITTLLRYRELQKLSGTFLTALVPSQDGRIHTTYRQAGTVSGRLSCADPNLQQIPRDGELKKIFVPAAVSTNVLIQADYNQIELRVLAHYSGDPKLKEAFAHGEDIHRQIAARVFRKRPDDISDAERSIAKQVSFGLIYGISAYGLARRLGITPEHGEEIIERYFREFSWVRPWIKNTQQEVIRNGILRTEFGRTRHLRISNAKTDEERGHLLRQAVNFPIQSLAADLTTFNLVRFSEWLERENLNARIVATVHDSVIVDCPSEEQRRVCDGLRRIFVDAELPFRLAVPLRLDIKAGKSWGELNELAPEGAAERVTHSKAA